MSKRNPLDESALSSPDDVEAMTSGAVWNRERALGPSRPDHAPAHGYRDSGKSAQPWGKRTSVRGIAPVEPRCSAALARLCGHAQRSLRDVSLPSADRRPARIGARAQADDEPFAGALAIRLRKQQAARIR